MEEQDHGGKGLTPRFTDTHSLAELGHSGLPGVLTRTILALRKTPPTRAARRSGAANRDRQTSQGPSPLLADPHKRKALHS